MKKIIKCASCNKRKAPMTSYGPVWCKKCRGKYPPSRLGGMPEFIPDYIKEDRVVHAKDTVQPWRQGEASKEFIKLYPEEAKKTFTEKEMRGAKDTWRGVKGLRDIQEVK